MGALAHAIEAAGIATVGISLVREQAENTKAPRLLHCQFPLGRPLGKPDDAVFQRGVLERAFELLPRTDVPVLVDHPDEIQDQTEKPASCPMPARESADLAPAVDEANGLRSAYDRNLEATGRTLVGRKADAGGIGELLATFIRLGEGATLDDVGWTGPDLHGASHDIRAYYEEAAIQLADTTGARQIETWLYQTTEAGAVIRAAQQALKDAEVDHGIWFYVAPGTQGVG